MDIRYLKFTREKNNMNDIAQCSLTVNTPDRFQKKLCCKINCRTFECKFESIFGPLFITSFATKKLVDQRKRSL